MSRQSTKTTPPIYTAEQGLLKSLRRAELSRGAKDSREKNETGSKTHDQKLQTYRSFRYDKGIESKIRARGVVAEVQSVPFHVRASVHEEVVEGKRGIERMEESRRERHNYCLEKFNAFVRSLAGECAMKIKDASVDVNAAVDEIKGNIETVFETLGDEDKLASLSMKRVEAAWDQLDEICKSHKCEIKKFRDILLSIEEHRSAKISAALNNTIKELSAVGHALPEVIERIAERECYRANSITIKNFRQFSELSQKLILSDARLYSAAKVRHMKTVYRWRMLRHNQSIDQFVSRINSDEYVNPPHRQREINEMQASQLKRHSKTRVVVLERLKKLHPATLTTRAVHDVEKKLLALNDVEIQSNEMFDERIRKTHVSLLKDAHASLERLRQDLHSFGALVKEPDKSELSSVLTAYVRDASNADLFRKAGNLKRELEIVAEMIASSDLVYEKPLTELKSRMQTILSCLDIERVLEDQGKLVTKRSCEETLETMRNAKVSDLGRILPLLLNQVQSLANCNILDETLIKELVAMSSKIENLSVQIGSVRQNESSVCDNHTVRTRRTKASVGTKKSVGFGGSRASTAGSDQHLSPTIVSGIRNVQRHLGFLLALDRVSDAAKQTLKQIASAVEVQISSNEAVDRTIREKCVDSIERRKKEYNVFEKVVTRHLARQTDMLNRACRGIVSFHQSIAEELECHTTKDDEIDRNSREDFLDLEDDFEHENGKAEDALSDSKIRLRQSADADKLKSHMSEVLERLSKIEASYRSYYDSSMKLAAKHPVDVTNELFRFLRRISEIFGLVNVEQARAVRNERDAQISQKVDELKKNTVSLSEGTPGGAETDTTAADGTDNQEKCSVEESSETLRDQAESHLSPPHIWCRYSDEEILRLDKVECGGVDIRERLDVLTLSRFMLDGKDNAGTAMTHHEEEIEEEETTMGVDGERSDIGRIDALVSNDVAAADGDSNASRADIDTTSAPKVEVASSIAGKVEEVTEEEEVERMRSVAALQHIEVPVEFTAQIVQRMRGLILEMYVTAVQKRGEFARVLRDERKEDLTEQLEERLRKHWPRKGRVEVKINQPRAAELQSHREKLQRHVRNLIQRDAALERRFLRSLNASKKETQLFLKQKQERFGQLRDQQTLAGLQGLSQKATRERVEFEKICARRIQALGSFVCDEPKKLIDANEEFLKTCNAFDNDGDYNPEEIVMYRKSLAEISTRIQKAADARKDRIEKLRDDQKRAWDDGEDFNGEMQRCVQDLSMRDGLGKKYGAPRRNCQERLRSEVARSGRENANISDRMRKLAQLAAETTSASDDKSLSVRILTELVSIRRRLRDRAMYLECITPEGLRASSLAQVEIAEVTTTETSKSVANDASPMSNSLPNRSSFMSIAREATKTCAEETRALYASEGKEGQVPASLNDYLSEQLKKASRARDSAVAKLRDQLVELEQVLLKIPECAILDVAKCAEQRRDLEISQLYDLYSSDIGQLKEKRAQNERAMKPKLCKPAFRDQFEQLLLSESKRSSASQSLSRRSRVRGAKIFVENFSQFQIQFERCVRQLLILLDSMLCVADLDLPEALESENVQVKSRSLRRLRRLHRRKKIDESNADSKNGFSSGADGSKSERGRRRRRWRSLPRASDAIAVPRAWIGLEEKDESDAKDGDKLQTADGLEPSVVESDITPAHRQLIRSRDSIYDNFRSAFRRGLDDVRAKFTAEIDEEAKWAQNWEKMVSRLRSSLV